MTDDEQAVTALGGRIHGGGLDEHPDIRVEPFAEWDGRQYVAGVKLVVELHALTVETRLRDEQADALADALATAEAEAQARKSSKAARADGGQV